jgi:hypothetical protein
MTYRQFAKNYHSANGEDGIINQLFKDLNITDGVVCEFGAWDGILDSNTAHLWLYRGFKSVLIEGIVERYNTLIHNTKDYDNVICINEYISEEGENSIDNILSNCSFKINKDNFALMSVDIDSFDYYVIKSIEKFFPKVLIVECNGGYRPHQDFISRDSGCSLKSVIELGEKKGYKCVAYVGNAILVRNDLAKNLPDYNYNINELYITPEELDELVRGLNPKSTCIMSTEWYHG